MIKTAKKGVQMKGTTLDLIQEYVQITETMCNLLEKNKVLDTLGKIQSQGTNDITEYFNAIIEAQKKFTQRIKGDK